MTDKELTDLIAEAIGGGCAHLRAGKVLAALREANVMPVWRGIESAPKDGTQHLRWSAEYGPTVCNEPKGFAPGKWEKDGPKAKDWSGHCTHAAMTATHWQPLPEN